MSDRKIKIKPVTGTINDVGNGQNFQVTVLEGQDQVGLGDQWEVVHLGELTDWVMTFHEFKCHNVWRVTITSQQFPNQLMPSPELDGKELVPYMSKSNAQFSMSEKKITVSMKEEVPVVMAGIPFTVSLTGIEHVFEGEVWEKVVDGYRTGATIRFLSLYRGQNENGAQVEFFSEMSNKIDGKHLIGATFVPYIPSREEVFCAEGLTDVSQKPDPKKYYYALIEVEKSIHKDRSYRTTNETCEIVLDQHPLRYVLDSNGTRGNYQFSSDKTYTWREIIKVLFYHELTEAEYNEFKDHF